MTKDDDMRILTRCPVCGNDTLILQESGYLLCTWHNCGDPLAINKAFEVITRTYATLNAIESALRKLELPKGPKA